MPLAAFSLPRDCFRRDGNRLNSGLTWVRDAGIEPATSSV